ncbi:multidrug effflux MFS transporter [Maritalea porphyrae]|jgi:DHA1 family bicyclomycin/chloramphenicol resistance-like MFS transporter|uniref:multidrug effflux MFS transporter n=1 Tax=Maritalea porphyrae TaxID=880732 RepID=UPI0022AF253F|nr:multidrug effflux MFS transporter [Maritalea porphyrae]MCZ4271361.1 multidrug effflux MFS transporter [Maritalea porphyrae]
MLRLGLILGVIIFVGSIAIDIYIPVMPNVADDLGATTLSIQTTLTVYFLCFGVAQLLYGPWSDRVGRKPPLYFGLLIFLVGTVLCALSPSVVWLIVGRGLQGLGSASQMVLMRAVVREKYQGADAAKLMGYVMMVTAISPLIAPLLGSMIAQYWGWRWIFGGLGVLTLLAFFIALTMLEETNPLLARSVLKAATPWSNVIAIFQDGNFVVMTLLGAFGFAGMFVHIASGAFVYQQFFGLTALQFSLVLGANSISFFATALLSSNLAARFGNNAILMVGAAGYAASTGTMVLLALIGLLKIETLIGIMFLSNGFLGLLIPLAMVLSLNKQGERAGLASSVGGTLQMLIGGAVIGLFGIVSDGSPQSMAIGLFACAVLGLLVQILNQRLAHDETLTVKPSL